MALATLLGANSTRKSPPPPPPPPRPRPPLYLISSTTNASRRRWRFFFRTASDTPHRHSSLTPPLPFASCPSLLPSQSRLSRGPSVRNAVETSASTARRTRRIDLVTARATNPSVSLLAWHAMTPWHHGMPRARNPSLFLSAWHRHAMASSHAKCHESFPFLSFLAWHAMACHGMPRAT